MATDLDTSQSDSLAVGGTMVAGGNLLALGALPLLLHLTSLAAGLILAVSGITIAVVGGIGAADSASIEGEL